MDVKDWESLLEKCRGSESAKAGLELLIILKFLIVIKFAR